MAYVRRTWQERVGTLLNRFTKSSETPTSVVLVNDPDTITQAGTPFTAAAMNNIEDGIVEALAKVPTGVNNNILLSDGAGKAKDSGKAIGNASGNVPLANGSECENLLAQKTKKIEPYTAAAGSDLVVEAYNRVVVSSQIELVIWSAVGAPKPAKTFKYKIYYVTNTRWTVIAECQDDYSTYQTAIVNGVPPTWAQLTDASGNAVFPSVATTASAANAYIAGSGSTILQSTSSSRYKTAIRDLDDSSTLDRLRPVLYKSNPETVPGDDPTLDHYGFIAEDIDEVDEKLVQYKEDESGEKTPNGVQYDRITVLLVKRIHELEARLAKAGI